MTDKSFRVLLDVTDLYLENFKYVWINVSPRELKTICDLKKHVLCKINLEKDIQLFVRDGLLLDDETIVILREDDTVKIKYKSPVCKKLEKGSMKDNANFSQKRNLSESNFSDEDISSKRRKSEVTTNRNGDNLVEKKSKKRKKEIASVVNSANASCSSVEKSKKQKELSMNSENFCSFSIEGEKQTETSKNFENYHSNLLGETHSSKKNPKKKDKKKLPVTYDQSVTNIDFCKTNNSFQSFNAESIQQKQNKNNPSSESETSSEYENIPIKSLNNGSSSKEKKMNFQQNESPKNITIDINSEELNDKNLQPKKKRKRRRKRKKSEVTVIDICDETDNFKSFSENVDDNSDRKHILYLSPDINKKSNGLKDQTEFCNPSTNTFVLIEDKFADMHSQNYPKMSTPVQSNNCVPDLQLSLMPSKKSNLSCNENGSILHGESARKNKTAEISRENTSKEQLYEDLIDITSIPSVGTHIAYKVLALNENYSPTLTDYREGVVETVNSETEELGIKLKEEIILPGRSGKFENLGKDEVPEDIVKTYDFLKWKEIISPKFLLE